jgi:very-short-patch-repair endonuclease
VRSDEICVHRIARLHPQDATRNQGIPVTSPARTLLDLAATTNQRDLARVTEEAQVQRRVSTHSLNEQFSRYPTHRGTAALRHAIRADPALTRSEAERIFLELIRAARLPAPEGNVELRGWEVDFIWPDRKLVVEIDGYAFHSSRSSFERDRRRDRELQAAGYRVLRFTWRELTEEREAVVATLAAERLTCPA